VTTHTEAEITSQSDCRRRAAGMVPADALPQRGERVAVVGCGTSWFIAQAYAALREGAGHGETDAIADAERALSAPRRAEGNSMTAGPREPERMVP
jgi:fructoselysine-6-P-deglycase FrlB-like protein